MRHIKELQCPYCHKNVYGGNKGLYKLICPTCNSDQPVPSMYKPIVNFTCHKCKNNITLRRCTGCGKYLVLSEYHSNAEECKLCASNRRKVWAITHREDNHQRNKRGIKKMAEKAENNYEQLKMLQKKVPSKPMTEEEWRDICDFMGGCTLCGNPHIEVRSFLVPAVEGGAYSKYNMFPLCCDCDVTGRQHANPFKYFNDRTRLKKPQRERFKKLVDYLINLIEEDLADEKKN